MSRFVRVAAALLAALLLFAGSAAAQEDPKAQLERIKTTLDRIEQTLQRPGVDQAALQALRDDIDPLLDQLRDSASQLEPARAQIEERLKELGDPPGQGRTEDASITRDREETRRRLGAADADLRQARFLAVRAGQISERLADRRRELLTRQLFERSPSIADPALWRDVAAAAPRLASSIAFFVQDWFALLGASGSALGYLILASTIALAALLYWPARRRLLATPLAGWIGHAGTEAPTSLQRSVVAAWTAVVNALLPALAAFFVVRVLQGLDLVPFRFGFVANALVVGLVMFSGLRAVTAALVAPDRPAWRFVPVSDEVARQVMRTSTAMAATVAIFYVLQNVGAAIVAPLVTNVALLGASSLAFAAVVAVGIGAGSRIEAREREAQARDPYAPPRRQDMASWRLMRLGLWLAAAVVAGAAVAGYNAFGAYLAGQVVWILIVLGGLKVLLNLVDDAATELTRRGSPGAWRISSTLGVEQTSVEQVGIVLSGVVRVVLLVAAAFMIIVPWGVESRDALGAVRALFFGVQIGGVSISISAVLLAVTAFAIGLLATRGVQRWLDDRLLPATRMDIGLRNSVHTVFGYVGFIIAAMVGFSFLGADLQNLAIVAGALSVGIGFGLQSIVSNFVSGLILLAERPIKAGDWIVVGDAEGYVRRINVRSTEIETFDKAVVIVPNANLVSGTVRNWMHNDLLGRARVKVTVPHGTDPEKVRDILVDIARDHPIVTSDPEPRAALIDFVDGGMVFELGFTVLNVDKAAGARSDVRYAILKRFAEDGIKLK